MGQDHPAFVPAVSVYPGRAFSYDVPVHWVQHGRPSGSPKARLSPRDPVELRKVARRRMLQRYWSAVGWLYFQSRIKPQTLNDGRKVRWRLGFLTLTIPGSTSADHRALKRLVLDPFFTRARNVGGLRSYVWTAELQQRGAIHWHVILDHWLDKAAVARWWLQACKSSGVVDMSDAGGVAATSVEILRNYNGTAAYAAKYIGKALGSGDITGSCWGGSHSVTGIKGLSLNLCDHGEQYRRVMQELNEGGAKWVDGGDHGTLARLRPDEITRRKFPALHGLLRRHYEAQGKGRDRGAMAGNSGLCAGDGDTGMA